MEQKYRVCVKQGNDVEAFELRENVTLLGAAVVLMAMHDLQDILEELPKASSRRKKALLKKKAECEEFFTSGRCENYCGIEGRELLNEVYENKTRFLEPFAMNGGIKNA